MWINQKIMQAIPVSLNNILSDKPNQCSVYIGWLEEEDL